jgi:uncharacterized protein YndB with AHSA1/START domain
MSANRRGSAAVEFPSDLELQVTREFDAPIELVFEVLTKPEHIGQWFAPFEETMTVCEIDLRVGGNYHYVFVTKEGIECSFRGTFMEIERPTRIVDTWNFEGWPNAEAVETVELSEVEGVTTLKNNLAFRDLEGRAHMSKTDGFEASFDKLEAYLGSLVGPEETTN